MYKLLCVCDDRTDLAPIQDALTSHDLSFDLVRCEHEAGFSEQLEHTPDAILCCESSPGLPPRRVLAIVAQAGLTIPTIVLTLTSGDANVAKLLDAGAHECLREDQLQLLGPVLESALSDRRSSVDRRRSQRALAAAYHRLAQVSGRLVDAQERERALIARELHDELGQTMTGIVLHLHAAQRAAARGAPLGALDAALELAKHAVEQVRRMSFVLRPPQLDLLGLSAAVRSAVERQLAHAGLRSSVRVYGREPSKPQANWIAAFRIVQEAITNVLRHAHATQLQVRLRFGDRGRLVVVIADDGKGFDVSGTLKGGVGHHNFGLNGMIERAQMAGGRLSIRSTKGLGTIVRAVFEYAGP